MVDKNNDTDVGRSSVMKEESSQLSEKVGSAVTLSFGRLNPPTSGHEKLVQKIQSVAKKNRTDAHLYMSHSQDKKKNPLSYDQKYKFARKAFGNVVQKSRARTIMQVLSELDSKYDEVYIVVGGDRLAEFRKLLEKYNGSEYNYSKLEVISAGERDPDADDVTGMSASKLRSLASEGKFDEFRKGVPSKLNDRDAKGLYDAIRSGMNISEEVEQVDEVLDMAQRRARGRMMKRIKGRIARGQRIARRRKASQDKLKVRAQRKAKQEVRKKVAGKQGVQYKDLPAASKIQIDKRVEKKKALVNRLSKRMLPKVRKAEAERLKKMRMHKESIDASVLFDLVNQAHLESIDESVEKNLLRKSERFGVPLDTVKELYLESIDAYDPETTEKEEEQWVFNRLSVLLANMREENENEKEVKARINREKKNDQVKFDRMRDRARLLDARAKNRNTRPKNN